MENLYVKDMVSSLDAKLYCVGTDWTLHTKNSFYHRCPILIGCFSLIYIIYRIMSSFRYEYVYSITAIFYK